MKRQSIDFNYYQDIFILPISKNDINESFEPKSIKKPYKSEIIKTLNKIYVIPEKSYKSFLPDFKEVDILAFDNKKETQSTAKLIRTAVDNTISRYYYVKDKNKYLYFKLTD